MGNRVKRMNIKEFRKKGYLQEVNRRFLHPLGLALQVIVDSDGSYKLSGILDCRGDKEGIYYDVKNSSKERKSKFKKNKDFIDAEFKRRLADRIESLGFDLEPVDENEIEDSKILDTYMWGFKDELSGISWSTGFQTN